MAITPFKPSTNTAGRFGEGAAFDAVNYLKDLRSKLEAGEVQVNEFVRQGKKAAEFIYGQAKNLGGSGSAGATVANNLLNSFANANTGLSFDPGGTGKVITDLPQEFQQRLRDELLPENISQEERERILADIPNDIGFDTDRFDLEREGIRQSLQTKKTADQQSVLRKNRLDELANLLGNREETTFNRNRGLIAEDAQRSGLLETSGFGDALAKYRTQLTEDTRDTLLQQGVADRDMDINALADALARRQTFQSSGLSRDFSLSDKNQDYVRALEFARLTTPQSSGGKSSGEKWATGIGLALNGVQTGYSMFGGGPK